MQLGLIGLGRMGGNMRERLRRAGHEVVGYDPNPDVTDVPGLGALVERLSAPRVVWIMVPVQFSEPTIDQLRELLSEGDIVIDGGNSRFSDDPPRAEKLGQRGIGYLDVGVSGGVWGLENGYALMVGGDLARPGGLAGDEGGCRAAYPVRRTRRTQVMFVRRLELVDFRSYPHIVVEFEAGCSVLVGPNGVGKTNLLEAMQYVSTLDSHRVAVDAPLIRAGAASAVVRSEIVHDGRSLLVELSVEPGKANRARLNGSPVRRPRDVLGAL